MSLLGSASGISGLLNSATGLVNALKQPRVSNQDFAALLQSRVAEAKQERTPEAQRARLEQSVTELSAKYVGLRDADGDGLLKLEESGLDPKVFAAADADKDGRLSAQEIKQYTLNALQSTPGA
ncbi:MAG: hypothetical protein GC168_11470 [Candidatus Hydrogenedens sp.]|nr:hypothetical protein [Candidatus Hydrogenedens sp.]